MKRLAAFGLAAALSLIFSQASESKPAVKNELTLHLRTRGAAADNAAAKSAPTEKTAVWNPKQTALIIVDMWDDHWCKGAAGRVTEMAPAMNKLVHSLRNRGVFIIHCPSTCVDFYKDTPQRKRAIAAPPAKVAAPLSQTVRWGTKWLYPDPKRESPLPIDDSDMGCDCQPHCKVHSPWTRQTKLIDIEEPDAISDDGQEVYNLLAERKIDNLLILGVHLNMCVLGRPFGIRQLVDLGKNVVLVRDMTDTMYNHEMTPKVDHFTGTDLVVEHVERNFCPSITSVDLIGGLPFRFKEDKRGPADQRGAK